MATSSIYAHVKISDPQKVELFANVLEASEKEQFKESSAPSIPILKDLDAIRELLARRNAVFLT